MSLYEISHEVKSGAEDNKGKAGWHHAQKLRLDSLARLLAFLEPPGYTEILHRMKHRHCEKPV